MRGVVFPGDRLVSYVDVPDPTPGPLDVIVEMKASGMCGTDLQNYRRPRDQAPYMPSLIGRPPIADHEPAGIVCAVGTAVPPAQARVGERVMVHHYQGCTTCDHCRSGWQQLCQIAKPMVRVYGKRRWRARAISQSAGEYACTAAARALVRGWRRHFVRHWNRLQRGGSSQPVGTSHDRDIRPRTGRAFGDPACACHERARDRR